MMTPKEKAEELYNRFDRIIYTGQDYKAKIFACMNYHIESMVNEHNFDENDESLLFWESVKVCKEEIMKKNNKEDLINYIHGCTNLKDKKTPTFDEWLKKWKWKQISNSYVFKRGESYTDAESLMLSYKKEYNL